VAQDAWLPSVRRSTTVKAPSARLARPISSCRSLQNDAAQTFYRASLRARLRQQGGISSLAYPALTPSARKRASGRAGLVLFRPALRDWSVVGLSLSYSFGVILIHSRPNSRKSRGHGVVLRSTLAVRSRSFKKSFLYAKFRPTGALFSAPACSAIPWLL
jgi:hypothetical protein